MNFEIKELSVSEIKPDKNQPRKSFDDESLQNLAESILSNGLINPIEVDENNVIITGEQRWRAHKIAKLKTIECKIVKGQSKMQRLGRQLSENISRNNLKIHECIDSIKEFMEELKKNIGSTSDKLHGNNKLIGETAKRIGTSERWLHSNLKFDEEAPAKLKKAVHDGDLSISVATEIMSAPEEERDEITETAIQLQSPAVVGTKKVESIREIVRTKKEQAQTQKALEELKKKNEEIKDAKKWEVKVTTTEEVLGRIKEGIFSTYRELDGLMSHVRRIKSTKFYLYKAKEKENFFKVIEGTIKKVDAWKKELQDFKDEFEIEIVKE